MLTVVAVFALVMGYIALVAAYLALRTLARLRRAAAVLGRTDGGKESIIEAAERHIAMTVAVAAEIEAVRAELAEARNETSSDLRADKTTTHKQLAEITSRIDADSARSLRNVALVRYDAFDDMAGRMSFSLALLDDHGDGVTLSAIAARTDTRVYAKGIAAGAGQSDLTPEEIQAVGAALRRPAAKVERATRRRAS
jgi:hypothetical protein